MTAYRATRRRRRLRLLIPLVIVAVLAGLVYMAAAEGTVIPGLTARVHPIRYQRSIERAADRYGVDPYLVAAVVHTESGYDPEAVSHAGAVGLMQLMPDTAAWIVELSTWRGAERPEVTDPDDNLELGTCYLAFLIDRFGEDTRAAVAAYNAGQGEVASWLEAADGGNISLDDIRFSETRTFVKRVEETWDLYKRIHPEVFGDGAVRT